MVVIIYNNQSMNLERIQYIGVTHLNTEFVSTVKALIKAPLKNNYDLQRRLVWSKKNYFGPLGVPCLERHLRFRVQLRPFQ